MVMHAILQRECINALLSSINDSEVRGSIAINKQALFEKNYLKGYHILDYDIFVCYSSP